MTQPLTGLDLLTKVKEMHGASKKDLARACGYYSTQGNERARLGAFYAALLEAKGINLGSGSEPTPRGKLPSFRTRVHFNGNLLVGVRYVEQLGFKPGDEFEIKLSKNGIRLVPLDQVDAEDEFEEEDEALETLETLEVETLSKTEEFTFSHFPSRLVS